MPARVKPKIPSYANLLPDEDAPSPRDFERVVLRVRKNLRGTIRSAQEIDVRLTELLEHVRYLIQRVQQIADMKQVAADWSNRQVKRHSTQSHMSSLGKENEYKGGE